MVLVALAVCGIVGAQQSPFVELRRWPWRTPDVSCAAGDAAGTIVALGMKAAAGDGFEIVLYDPTVRRELRRLPLARKPSEVRFRVADHVDVRLREHDTFLSLSHWHRLALVDGREVGDAVLHRLEDDEPAVRALLQGRREPGPGPTAYRNAGGSVCWWRDGKSHAITDAELHALELTADGRFAVLWLPSRIVAVPVGGGETSLLDVPSEDVRAIEAGDHGDEVLVVTTSEVRCFRAGSGRQVRRVSHTADVVAAALAAGGPLALAQGDGGSDVVLLDLLSGRETSIDTKARALSWTADGQRLLCSGTGITSFTREGRPLWSGEAAHLYGQQHRLLAIDGKTDVWHGGFNRVTWVEGRLVPANSTKADLFLPWGMLATNELVCSDADRLLLCDAVTWQGEQELDLGADIAAVAVAPAVRRVAVIAGSELIVWAVKPPTK